MMKNALASKTVPNQEKTLLDEVTTKVELQEKEVAIEDMPLTSLFEYNQYNKRAREANKRLKICRYPAKPCPVELHPKQRIVFGRNDQPTNHLSVYISDSKIEFEQELVPGQTYDLPLYVIEYLSKKGTPVYNWFDKPDGSRETREVSKSPRFAIRTVYAG